ncbi:MAG: EamA family transporter [Acidobacteria bacterium]|nr:EamA family transporter [Acidobacteriota bacterium]
MSINSGHLVWKTRLFAAIVVTTNVVGNFALSWGIKHGAAMDGSAWSFVRVVFDPWVFCGILLLSVWMLSRMALLSWADLSYVIPVTSIGFVLNAAMGAAFLDEKITPMRWAGTLCIVGGTILVGLTAPKSEAT